jgi:hypothetical protein
MHLTRNVSPSGKHLFDSGFLREDNLIIMGDLNFTLTANEVWGTTTRIDPLPDLLIISFIAPDLLTFNLQSLHLPGGMTDLDPMASPKGWIIFF